MTGSDAAKRFERATEDLRALPDALDRLDALRSARQRLESLEAEAVGTARESGVTWKAIGALYGLSKQGAQQRFGAARPGAQG